LFTNSLRSTLELWLAGIPRLVGFTGSLRSRLLDQVTPEARAGMPPEHQALKYMRLATHCGAPTGDAAHFAVGKPFASHDGVRRVGIVAGAEYGPAKRWPMERFAAMANSVSERHAQVEWVLFGAPGEKEQGAQLSAMLTAKHVNLVGQTSLTDLIECLQECHLLVTNDTGTMHLASALGVPTVSIFGSTEPILTGPCGPSNTIVRHHVPCSPCFKRECPLGHYECLMGIQPTQVADAVARQLALG
jgi:lipopolysaccharide heptosyltransferase II